MVILTAWCLHMRGPLFVSIFSPLTLVSVSIVGSLLLDEKLHLGRYIFEFEVINLCIQFFYLFLLT